MRNPPRPKAMYDEALGPHAADAQKLPRPLHAARLRHGGSRGDDGSDGGSEAAFRVRERGVSRSYTSALLQALASSSDDLQQLYDAQFSCLQSARATRGGGAAFFDLGQQQSARTARCGGAAFFDSGPQQVCGAAGVNVALPLARTEVRTWRGGIFAHPPTIA
eukprot:302418-Chlamydomonas_euryale.AAC.4